MSCFIDLVHRSPHRHGESTVDIDTILECYLGRKSVSSFTTCVCDTGTHSIEDILHRIVQKSMNSEGILQELSSPCVSRKIGWMQATRMSSGQMFTVLLHIYSGMSNRPSCCCMLLWGKGLGLHQRVVWQHVQVNLVDSWDAFLEACGQMVTGCSAAAHSISDVWFTA